MDFTMEAFREVVLRLIEGVPGVRLRAVEGKDPHLKSFLRGDGGWDIPDVLRTAASCALVKELPSSNPDVQFVAGALKHYGYSTSNKNMGSFDEAASIGRAEARTRAITALTEHDNSVRTGDEPGKLIKYDSPEVLNSVTDRLSILTATGLFKNTPPPFEQHNPVRRHKLDALELGGRQCPPLSQEQRDILRCELAREDLAWRGSVLQARQDLAVGHFDAAVSRLRIDVDKLRTLSPALAQLVDCQYPA